MNTSRVLGGRREVGIAAAAVAITAALWSLGWLKPLDRPVGDLLLRLPRPGAGAESPIAAVLVDDASIADLGPLPWSRGLVSELVDSVRRQGARAVVLDLILSEPSGEDADAALARALDNGPSMLAAVLHPQGGWLLPIERFGGARRSAHAHAEVASDGVVRMVSATKQSAGLALPALSLAAARLAGWEGAVTPGALLRPDFRQPPEAIPSTSARAVLDGDPESSVLAGRVVFIGLTASGTGDQFVVPTGRRGRPAPGVLVHAAVSSSILRGGLLRPLPWWAAGIMALALALAFQLARSRAARLRAGAVAIAVASLFSISVMALWLWGLQLPLVGLTIAVTLSAILRETLESREAQRESDGVLRSLIAEQRSVSEVGPRRDVRSRLQLARRLQEQLARDRNQRRSLIEGLHEGVVLWSDAGDVLVSNRALEDLWGDPPSLARVVEATGAGPPEVGGSVTAEVERAGRYLEVAIIGLEEGRLGLMRDISLRRELDRRRRETQRMVSHELKTPLASIAGFGAMIEKYPLSGEELKSVAGRIRGEADRLGEMVRSFLDLERLGAGAWEGERIAVDLRALVGERCQLLSAAAADRRQEIVFDGSGPLTIRGLPELISRLVDNLIGNALKFSPDGATVRLRLEHQEQAVALSVADNGEGIPEGSLPHLFERFYRVPGSGAGGSGLGLALVKEVADLHDARIEVASEPGRGSTFTVLFPST